MSLPERVGPYEVLGSLGQGGMGAVLRVRHPTLEAERALKVLLRATPKQKERFEREMLRLARIRHPNVVGIHDSGVADDGRPYFVMDLLEGRTLDVALAEDGAPALERALEWAIGICAGVQALHEQGIIHRDLKPQNVLLTSDGRPVVLDVGLAVDPERDERLTRTGALVGTLHYMAPEQLGKGEPSLRTDVYALGLITFELLTGQSAAPTGASTEVAAKIINQDRPLPGSVDGGLPHALDRVSARATHRDPDERYADAGELAAALRAVLDHPGLSRRTLRAFQLVIALLSVGLLVALAARGAGGPAPEATFDASPSSASAQERRAVLSRLQRLRTAEARAKGAAAWLASHPNDPGREQVEQLRDRARDQWARSGLKHLRGLEQDPAALYRAVRSWEATFGADHKNAPQVRQVLRRVAREHPIRVFERAWFADFLPAEQLLSSNHEGLQRWDRRSLSAAGARFLTGGWSSRPDRRRRGVLHAALRDNLRALSWHDLETGDTRPFVTISFQILSARFSPGGKVVALRGFRQLELRSFPEGALLYRHDSPGGVRITHALPDDQGRVAITYWGTLRHEVRPPPVVDVRRVSDDRLLKRHQLVGSGMYLDLAPDGRTLACATTLGRLYLFDLQDPSKSAALAASDLTEDPARGVVEPRAIQGTGRCAAFSPDGTLVFTVSASPDLRSGEVRGYDIATRKQVLVLKRPHAVKLVTVSPDGRWLLLTCDGQPFELWLWRP